ncbi:MAG: hypothetical protein AAF391_03140 [Bacteroidota bacterium]
MKKTIIATIICLGFSIITIAQDQTTTFTTSGSGWYKIGGWTTGAKRGAVRVVFSTSGGSFTPQSLVIDAYKNWSSGLYLEAKSIRNFYIDKVRIVEDGGIYHIEAYFDRAISSSASLRLYHIEGYTSGFNLFSGTLSAGAGNVLKETKDIYQTTEIENTFRTRGSLFVEDNVSIGSETTNQKLEIFNPNAFNINMEAQSQDHISLSSNDPGNGNYFGGITWKSSGRRRAAIAATREHNDSDYVGIAFFTRGTDGPGPIYESMRITRNGNVGIGTTTPSNKLEVNGTIRSKEVKVEASPWPDYVFKDSYKLPSLKEVKSYINKNKHLPDVPSAKEVESDGVKLGEMNAILLKKIEELTLYQIQLMEELESVKEELKELKSDK